MKFKQTNLPHGGKLYYVKNNINKSTVVDINFDCGSRCDTIPGLAHFTEHMFLSGTDNFSKQEITKKYYDFIDVNMFTSIFSINFCGQVFTHEFEKYIKTVTMMLTESTFSKENVEKEIPVVQQEISNNRDKHSRISSFINDYLVYGLIEFKNQVSGNEKTVSTIKSEDVKEYVNKYFVANNLEVFVSSPYSMNKVKKLVTKNLVNKLPHNDNFEKLPYFYYNVKNKNFFKVETRDIGKCYLYINFFINKTRWDFQFKYKVSLIFSMMHDFSEGVLNDLRLKNSLVYHAGFTRDYLDDSSNFIFRTECNKKNINKVIITLSNYLRNICKKGFTQQQLDKAKRIIDYNEVCNERTLKSQFKNLYQFKYYGKILKEKEAKKAIKSATLEEVNALYREVFKNPTVSLLVYGDAIKEEIMSKAEFNKCFKS